MQVIQLFDRQFLQTEAGGTRRDFVSVGVPAGLQNKNLGFYIMVHATDTGTRLYLEYQSGPDGETWGVPANIFDSGGGAGVNEGLIEASSATDVTTKAQLRFEIGIEDTGLAVVRKATVSVWAVLKPF